MVNDCYFGIIAQCPLVLRNVQVYCATSKVKIYPYEINFDSISQCLNMLRNVWVYYAMSEVNVDTYEMNPNATILHKD